MKLKNNTILALASALTLASCSEDKKTDNESSAKDGSPLDALVLAEEPAKATNIAALRTSAKPGDKVTFSGDILGSMNVFMEGRVLIIF